MSPTPTPGTSQSGTKAILAAVIAFLSSLLATVQGRTDLDTMTVLDWLIVLLAAAISGLTVYSVPNSPKD